jgi:hypothetical protein
VKDVFEMVKEVIFLGFIFGIKVMKTGMVQIDMMRVVVSVVFGMILINGEKN